MTALKYLTFLIVVFIPGMLGQLTSNGSCPTIPSVCKFKWEWASGKWFLQQTYIQNTETFACTTELYTLNLDGTISVTATTLVTSQNETITAFRGLIYPDSCQCGGGLVFVSVDTPPHVLRLSVVGAQNNTYLMTYGCVALPGNQKQELLYVLTKEQCGHDDEQVQARLRQLNNQHGININKDALVTYDQSEHTCG